MPRQRWLWILIGLALALGLASTALARFYTEILWFKEVGYISVFTKILKARWGIGLAGGVLFFLVAFLNLEAVIWKRRDLTLVGGLVMPVPLPLPAGITRWVALIAAIVGFLGGVAAYSQWHIILAYFNATPFNIKDPFFGKDVGFYIFSLPFISLIQQHLWVALLAALLLAGVLYFVLGDLRFGPRRILANRRARVHLSVLAAILFALKAWGYQISTWNLMYSPRGVAFGASYTDIYAQVPAYRVLMIASIAGMAVSLLGLAMRNFRWIGVAVVGLVGLSIVVGYAYPAFMQQFTVSPNELAYEAPFIEKNIQFTRDAFGLNKIQVVEYPAEDSLSKEDIEKNPGTIENLRLWDYRALKDTYSQVQEIRMYYRFNDVDIDRYVVNQRYRQVLLSARELDVNLLPAEARTWINIHLKYTHGYGLVMSPSSEVTREGMPAFYFMDVPPKTTTDLVITRPEIYFGELTDHYIIVKTKEPEFDFPRTDTEAIEPTFYEGTAGIPLSSFLNRLAFMLRFRDYQILVSGAITPESRIVMRRNIVERVKAIAPFFMYDSDPYLVLADGRLYWFIDGYTVSANYPYSQPDSVTGVNYIRNSVKAVIDAYNGSVVFYRADEEDPILRTYEKIFPGLVKPMSEMPPNLLAHIRFPQDLFMVQSRMLLTYHMTNPQVYYNKEDYWEIPKEVYANQEKPVEPYYLVLTIPGEPAPEYVLITPFTPTGKPNMTAWLAVRCDPAHYGEMILFMLPKDKLIPGPMQVESLFAQNPLISEAMTLWGQVDSQVIRGNLLTIPVNGSFLYVEPLYIQAERVKIPELKRVLMYAGGKVVMGTSVQDALNQLLGAATTPPSGVTPPTGATDLAGLIARANQLYSEAQSKLRAGDWSGYGEAMEELGRVIAEMQRLSGQTAPAVPSP
ncbi:MAG TPA: UPF0182 family protein [Firmicutes bacterium]|nr:UPF0182 family protein [Candidatus Fermentithermobacillaceae bacterium]